MHARCCRRSASAWERFLVVGAEGVEFWSLTHRRNFNLVRSRPWHGRCGQWVVTVAFVHRMARRQMNKAQCINVCDLTDVFGRTYLHANDRIESTLIGQSVVRYFMCLRYIAHVLVHPWSVVVGKAAHRSQTVHARVANVPTQFILMRTSNKQTCTHDRKTNRNGIQVAARSPQARARLACRYNLGTFDNK